MSNNIENKLVKNRRKTGKEYFLLDIYWTKGAMLLSIAFQNERL